MDDEAKQLLHDIRVAVAGNGETNAKWLDEPDSLDTPGLFETARLIGKMLLVAALTPIIAGPMLIYGFVHGLNDKDDPRFAKRPSSDP
jgi:hypothetical protein